MKTIVLIRFFSVVVALLICTSMFSNEVLSMPLEPRVLQANQSGNSNLSGAVKLGNSCATNGPCEIGDRGPGGGIVFYVSDVPFTASGTECQSNCLYLEYATTGWLAQKQNPPQRDCYSWEIIQRPFTGVWEDPYCVLLKGNNLNSKTQPNIGSGFANTTKLLDAAGIKSGSSIARNYRGGGKSDWYIPSIDELVALNSTIKKWMDMQEGGHVFEIDPGVSDWGFSDEMWSSTASKNGYFYTNSAWTDVDTQPGISRNQIRPIRAFGIPNPKNDSKKIGNQALSSSGRCVPASVPFVSVKKPWKLNTKKCDQAKSQEYFMVFSEYGFSTTIPKNSSYASRVKILKSHFNTFLRSYNSRNGWSKPFTGCDPIAEEIYYCKFDIYRRVNSSKQHQVGHVTAQFYGIPAWDIEFRIFIEVENILFGE